MFSEDLKNVVIQVIKSWQVIAVSVTLVLYMSLVGYAAREHHKPAFVSKMKPKKKDKAKTAEKPAAEAGSEPTPPAEKQKGKKGKKGAKEPDEDEIHEEE